MTPVYLQQLRGEGRERERKKERKERRVIHLCAERVLVQSDEVPLPCLLHQIFHLLPPLCLIFLLSSYASQGEKHRARAKHASCELPKRNEQRGTKQEKDERTTILHQKFTSFWYRRTGLAESAGTTDSASRIGSMYNCSTYHNTVCIYATLDKG